MKHLTSLIAMVLLSFTLILGGCNVTPKPVEAPISNHDAQVTQGNDQLAKLWSDQATKLTELNAKITAMNATLATTTTTADSAAADIFKVKSDVATVAAKNQSLPTPLDWINNFTTGAVADLDSALSKVASIKNNLNTLVTTNAVAASNTGDLINNSNQGVKVQDKTSKAADAVIQDKNDIAAQLAAAKAEGRKELMDKVHAVMLWTFIATGVGALLGLVMLGFAPTENIGKWLAPISGLLCLVTLTVITFEGLIVTIIAIVLGVAGTVALVAACVFGYKWWVTHRAFTENVSLTNVIKNEVPAAAKYFEGKIPIAHSLQSQSTIDLTNKALTFLGEPELSPLAPNPDPVKTP